MREDPRKGKSVVKGNIGKAAKTIAKGYGLEEAFDLFYSAKKSEGMRERTLGSYVSHWRYFREWFDSAYPHVNEISGITPAMIREYVIHMSTKTKYAGVTNREKEAGLSPYTIAFRLRDLRTMFNFLAGEELIKANPVENIKQPRFDNEDKATFSDDHIRRLLEAPNTETYAGLRDRTLILLLADGGFRIHEALRLTKEFIDIKTRCVHLPAWMNKNRKPRTVPLSAEVIREVAALMNENLKYFGKGVEHVFLANYGEPLKADHFRKRLREHAVKAGIYGELQVSPHQFRSYFLTQFLLNGGDVFSAQRIVAHSSIQTTRRYVKLNDENIREQHAQFSPIAKLGMTRVGKRK
ncbi:tyrosine-type recombinase/integrase [Bacillus sp. 3255]|uniref:tyrosine-type recombinase/integrase n=1 Tax=Bacillus sp. 3255 TaxID=2817904 RepID=UPI00285F7F54|nr:tyrosine-type recombinase/integrase [Bacillus sp. 3255]MDR6883557.1 integrase/recombinase XerD [Bacillus sp. 3255]